MSKKNENYLTDFDKVTYNGKSSDFDYNKIIFDEIAENERSESQNIGYIRYSGNDGEKQLHIQLDVTIDNYGWDNVEKHENDDFKLPLELNNFKDIGESDEEKGNRTKYLEKIRNVFEKIDSNLEKDMDKILGKNSKKKYKYTSKFSKLPKFQDDDDDDQDEETLIKLKQKRLKYMKIKIPKEYNSGKILTEVYKKNSKDTEDYNKDGKYTLIEINKIDDLKQLIKFRGKYRFIVHPCKTWADKNLRGNADFKEFGVGFKLIRVVVLSNEQTPITKNIESKIFIDSDDEEEENMVKNLKALDVDKEDDDDDDSESDEESESEEKLETKSKSKQVKKSK